MKKLFVILLLISLLFNQSIQAQNRNIEFNHGKFNDLLTEAGKTNKMIYIDCYASWCGPCKWMAKNIFTNDTVADFYNQHFINAKIDMEAGEGLEIAKKYNVRNYPTMLYLSSDGTQLHRTCGSVPAQVFIENGKTALDPEKQLATVEAEFKKGTAGSDIALNYFQLLDQACLSASEAAGTYLEKLDDSKFQSADSWEVISQYLDNYKSDAFTRFIKDRDYFSSNHTPDSVNEKINSVYTGALFASARNKDASEFEMLKKRLRESPDSETEKNILRAEIEKAEYSKDWAQYAKNVNDFVEQYVSENPDELNNFAWNFYENVSEKQWLSKAKVWAKKATELNNSYANNDTFAAILYKLGEKSEAEAAAQTAIKLAQENGEDYGETEALLKKINALK